MGCCTLKFQKMKDNIIWIDSKINNEEIIFCKSEVEKQASLEGIQCVDNIPEAIKYLKKLKFVKAIIICNGGLFPKFIEIFKENINEFMLCPKIIIFTEDKDIFSSENENNQNLLINHPFYNSGGIVYRFDELLSCLKNDKITPDIEINNNRHSKLSELEQFNFEYISNKNQLILPIFFSSFFKKIDNNDIQSFNKKSLSKFGNNEISSLFEQLLSVNEVPYEIICKYWIRAYTYESDFYKEMNKNLRVNKTKEYLIFIQMMYEGVKLNSLKFKQVKTLYRGTHFNKKELEKLENSFKNKKKIEGFDLPVSLVYNKSFFSFSTDENEAKKFIGNVFLTLYITEGDHFSNCASIKEYSYYENENEVLFFPFACFEIKSIYINENNKYHNIELNYLGKYENLFKDKTPEELLKLVPSNSNFAKDVFASNIIDEKYKLSTKLLKARYKIILDKKVNRIKIFGAKFVINNKNNCHLNYKDKELELKEFIYITELKQEQEEDEFEIELKLLDNITDLSYMFDSCFSLLSVNDNHIFSGMEISKMDHLFNNCISLTELSFFKEWDISNVTDMSYLFCNCSSLTSIPFISEFTTSNVLNMNYMFYKCSSLISLDISNWDISNVENMNYMFYNCSSLETFSFIFDWKFTNLKSASEIVNKNSDNYYNFPMQCLSNK